MLHPVFDRAAKSVRSRLGLNALFAGAQTTKAPFEQGVEVQDGEGNVTIAHYVASIDPALDPREGDTLVYVDDQDPPQPIPGESYVLDTKLADNGANIRFILRKA